MPRPPRIALKPGAIRTVYHEGRWWVSARTYAEGASPMWHGPFDTYADATTALPEGRGR